MSGEIEKLLVCRTEDGAITGVFNVGQIFYGHLCSAYLGYFSPRYLKIAGRWRDHERWAILAEDLHPTRRRRT